jgi:hypothetical protein
VRGAELSHPVSRSKLSRKTDSQTLRSDDFFSIILSENGHAPEGFIPTFATESFQKLPNR